MRNFEDWNTLKQKLHLKSKSLVFKEGEIWWCSIGQNIGSEVYGKGQHFRRPVLVVGKISKYLCIVLPLTTKPHDGSWYVEVVSGDKTAWAMLHQIRSISISRLSVKVADMSRRQFLETKKALAKLLGLFNILSSD